MSKHFDRAELLYEQNRYDLAIAEIDRELAIDPNSSDAYCLLGKCLTAQAKYDRAIVPLGRAIHLDPERNDFHHALSHCYFSEYVDDRSKQHLLELAKSEIKEAMRLAPGEPQHIYLRSLILCEEGNKWELEKSIGIEINEIFNPQAKNERAIACWEESLKSIREARRLNPKDINYVNHQIFLLEKLNLSSDSTIEEAIAIAPNNSRSLNSYGWLLLERGNYTAASGYFQQALRLSPNLEPAKHGLLESLRSRMKIYRRISVTHKIPNTNLSNVMVGIFLYFGSLLGSGMMAILPARFPQPIDGFIGSTLITIGIIGILWTLASLVARYTFNWFLQFDRFSKQMLEQYDIIRASISGVAIITIVGLIIVAILSPKGKSDWAIHIREQLLFIEVFISIALLPPAITPSVTAGKWRRMMATYTSITLAFGLLAIILKIESADRPLALFVKVIMGFYLLAIFGSPIVAIELHKRSLFNR